ncbi:MAG TPA: ankyrin repeat domain-containing protein [Bradyrhizobium sp.]|nr:ankyrin repeat domain-containing protein [Bradyrhizobium sp.]
MLADGPISARFYDAIRANDLTGLRSLLQQSAGVNTRDARGETPLQYAAVVGSLDAMKLLIDAGADVNAQNNSGATALVWSATNLAKVKLLVAHGANVNAATKRGRTALLIAAMSDNSAGVVQFLLDNGADAKATDFLKTTALRAATLGNDTETIRMLIGAGIDVNAADLPGITPLMMAAGWNGNLAAVKLLLAHGAKVNAVSRPVMGLPSKNGPSEFGSLTALLMSAPFGPPELIRTLLDAGADVNAQDVRGMTPLMLAVATDHQDPAVIRMLIEHGADANIKSKLGETATDWARRFALPAGTGLLKVPAAEMPRAAVVAEKTLDPKLAAQRAVTLMEKTGWSFFANSGCVSCHAQSMTDMVVAEARAKGLHVDDNAARERVRMLEAVYPPEPLFERMDPAGAEEQLAYPLAGLALAGHSPDRLTDGMVVNIAATQSQNGSFHIGAAARPPGEEGDFFRTALCLRALKVYGPPGRAAEMSARVDKARRWLEGAKPVTAEDRNMQLLGLYWAGEQSQALTKLAKAILDRQQADGGWQQQEGLASDAYGTGESLYALAVAGGVSPRQAAYRKGVSFLLNTQRDDGSWFVRSRSPRIQAYFDGGFPYERDQWISEWATAWAAMALTQALDGQRMLAADWQGKRLQP